MTCLVGGACAAGFTIVNANTITFSGTVGQYTLAVSSTATNNPGVPGNAAMDIATNSVQRTTAGTNSLFIWASQTGFTQPTGTVGVLGDSGSASVTHSAQTILPGDSFEVISWLDTTNAPHNNVGNVGVPGTITAGPCSLTAPGVVQVEAGSCTAAPVGFVPAIPFSLTQRDTLFINSVAANTGEFANTTGSTGVRATAVPEPGSLLLLGTGFLGLANRVRSRMKK